MFLGFSFPCFFFLFFLRCSSSLLELDEEESREEGEVILLLFLHEFISKDINFFLLCLRSSELFSERSTLSSALFAILFQLRFEKKLLQGFSQTRELRTKDAIRENSKTLAYILGYISFCFDVGQILY